MAHDNIKRETQRHRRKRIALDFDGVLHKYSKKWHDGTIYDDPVPGAVEAVQKLAEDYDLIIFTCRSNIGDIYNWVKKHFELTIEVTEGKPHADMYIDDRGHYFLDWNLTMMEVGARNRRNFRPEAHHLGK